MASHILLVEDDPVSREVVAALLSSRGYIVETAEDGFNALRMAQEQTYDLVFIDYHLPEMDGYALARLMRSLGETSKRPLRMVAITADQFGLAARRGVDTIFDRVVSKPIEPDTLFGIVDEFLGTRALEELESFLSPDASSAAEDEGNPGVALWRARGFDRMPAACVFPVPTLLERSNIEACFRIVDGPAEADCLLVAAPAGLAAVETLRRDARDFLMPLVTLDPRLEETADALFDPGDGRSWDRTATIMAAFASRRQQLNAEAIEGAPIEIRLAAYLLVADRSLELARSASGETLAPYTGGFALAAIVAGVKQLAARGMMVPELKPSLDGAPRRLCLQLSPTAVATLSVDMDHPARTLQRH